MPIGIASEIGRTEGGLAVWGPRVHGADVPGRWVIIDRRFVAVRGGPSTRPCSLSRWIEPDRRTMGEYPAGPAAAPRRDAEGLGRSIGTMESGDGLASLIGGCDAGRTRPGRARARGPPLSGRA